MPDEWPVMQLTDLYDIASGLSKPRDQFGFGHGFLTFKDVLDNYFVPEMLSGLVNSTAKEQQQCSIRRGDVFLTRTSETQDELGMSSVALNDYKAATFNGFTKRLRPKQDEVIVPEFAAYYFRSRRFRQEVTAMSSLSTRASLNNEMISRLTIVVPPVSTQLDIGVSLKRLDDKIELNRRMNQTLEATAAAIFKAWFIDFEPVKAKAAGAKNFPSMPQPVFDALPSSLVAASNSLSGEIPKGWEMASVAEDCELVMGQSPPSEMYNEDGEGLPFHQGGGTFQERFPRHEVFCTVANRLAEPGDVLFTVRAPVGRLNMADRKLIVGRGVAAIRHRRGWRSFLFHHLKNSFQSEDSIGDGTIFASVNKDDMQKIRLLRPTDRMAEAFEQVVGPLDELFATNCQETATLAALRDSLLPKLLSGEVRVDLAATVGSEGHFGGVR
ncbi:MAG: restriction endonuclease subunit S [Phycisphaerae bacterium]|nr:restriction endonuclease subunit S [Phycisphaerae bacterium]